MKKIYAVAPGVEWVNGLPVPKNRQVELTAEEAAFDLGYARIELHVDKPAVQGKPAPVPAKIAD